MRAPVRKFLFLLLLGSVSLAADPATVIQQIRATQLDPSRSAEVKGLKVEIGGGGVLIIEKGVVVPASPIGSAAAEMIFLGRATIEISAPDPIEASQLELFTGSGKLSEDFEEAVFVVANDAAVHALLKRPLKDVSPETLARASDRYRKWLDGAERKQLSIESVLFADGLNDPFHNGFFAAFVQGSELGKFLFIHHPDVDEEITIGQFVPLSVEERDRRRIRKLLEREQRQGRLIGVRLEDLGVWDTWMSTSVRNTQGDEISSVSGFEPHRYVLELDIADRTLSLSGKARLDLSEPSGIRQLVKLRLHSDLTVQKVTVDGAAVSFFRSGPDLLVHLTSPPRAHETVSVVVEYSGELLEKGAWKTTALRDTSGWYPRAGTVDRARYDVTFRWPRDLTLLSAGKLLEGSVVAGRKWERRTLEIPANGFSFEVGRFRTHTFQSGHVNVTLGFDPEGRSLDRDIQGDIKNTVRNSLLFFEETYGPYPLDDLVVVTVPRDFSQSHLGFVTLSNEMMTDFDVFAPILGIEDRRTIIAHEIAHQWWGNLVGWDSYRDQWFTEALANYAAMQFSRKKLDWDTTYRLGPTTRWQQEVLATTEDGHSLESLGPLVLGARLNSSRSDAAYNAVVYKKGAIVIDMLARNYGEENFDRILRGVIRAAANRPISTKDLLSMVQAATNEVDVQAFAKQFIFETGVPVISYDYEFLKKGDSSWTVKGVAFQHTPVRLRYRIVARDVPLVSRGSPYEVIHEVIPETRVEEWTMAVPFQVGVQRRGDFRTVSAEQRELEKQIGNGTVYGLLKIQGKATPFEFEVTYEPRTLWLDRDKVALARFYSPRTSPKYVALSQARALAAKGEFDEAEERFRQVLRAHKTTEFDPHELSLGSDHRKMIREAQDEGFDAMAHLGIARLRLDQKDYTAVTASLRDARKSLSTIRRNWLDGDIGVLEARLNIEKGDHEGGFRRLRKLLLGRFPASDDPEGYAWLAIAAKMTGHPKELARAVEAARRKGVDTSILN